MENYSLRNNMEEYVSLSGRNLVIATCAVMDYKLEKLIESKLVNDTRAIREFLGTDGGAVNAPLGTFSAKIKGSYLLGLISKNEYEILNILRKLRNKFAHEPFAGFYIEGDDENNEKVLNWVYEILDRLKDEDNFFSGIDSQKYREEMKMKIGIREMVIKEVLFSYDKKFEERISGILGIKHRND